MAARLLFRRVQLSVLTIVLVATGAGIGCTLRGMSGTRSACHVSADAIALTAATASRTSTRTRKRVATKWRRSGYPAS